MTEHSVFDAAAPLGLEAINATAMLSSSVTRACGCNGGGAGSGPSRLKVGSGLRGAGGLNAAALR